MPKIKNWQRVYAKPATKNRHKHGPNGEFIKWENTEADHKIEIAIGYQPDEDKQYVLLLNGSPDQRYGDKSGAMNHAKRHMKHNTFE